VSTGARPPPQFRHQNITGFPWKRLRNPAVVLPSHRHETSNKRDFRTMVSKFSPLSRLFAGLGIVAIAALPALAQTPSTAAATSAPQTPAAAAPAAPATVDATKPADKKAASTSGTAHVEKHVEKKEATHKVAKNLHKDGKDGVQKPSQTSTQTPAAKKADESVKIESAPSKL
jgi:hypothetical protein